MRHRLAGRKLSRDNEHRLAMKRNLVCSLFEHERISTTLEKAKEVKGFAERLITLGKKGDLAARRRAISLLGNRDIIEQEEGTPVKKGTIIGKLFSEIAPRYLDRPGGYTRIIKLGMNRLGDSGSIVLLQLVGEDEGEAGGKSKTYNKRLRRAQAYEQMAKATGKKEDKEAPPKEETAGETTAEEATEVEGEKEEGTTAEQEDKGQAEAEGAAEPEAETEDKSEEAEEQKEDKEQEEK